MFGLLVADKNSDIFEIALAVVAPGTLEDLVQFGPTLFLARHRAGERVVCGADGVSRGWDGEAGGRDERKCGMRNAEVAREATARATKVR